MSRNQFQELLHGRTGRMRATRLAPALGCIGLLVFSAYFSCRVTGGDQVVANAVAKAAPDGYTLIVGNWNNFVANGAVYALKFDLKRDFTPTALLSETPVLITARGSLSATTCGSSLLG